MRVDLLYNKFPAKVRYGINIATAILVLICMGLVFIYGMNIFLLSFRLNERISSVWGSPMWTIRFWVPLGAALMFIQPSASSSRMWLPWRASSNSPTTLMKSRRRSRLSNPPSICPMKPERRTHGES